MFQCFPMHYVYYTSTSRSISTIVLPPKARTAPQVKRPISLNTRHTPHELRAPPKERNQLTIDCAVRLEMAA